MTFPKIESLLQNENATGIHDAASWGAVMRLIFCLALVMALTGCASRSVRVPATVPTANLLPPYLDLQPGWRLRVVTPLTKSGTYRPEIREEQHNGSTTLSLGDDFIGYETAYYAVQPRAGTGVHIVFTSAADTRNGSTTPQPHPRPRLFQLPRSAKYVRLLYVQRVSRTDHDMAVLASDQQTLLGRLTAQVQADPRACENATRRFCSWIPAGIAVRAEILKNIRGSEQWVPAQ